MRFFLLFQCFCVIFFSTLHAQVDDPDQKFNERKNRFQDEEKAKDTFVLEDAKAFVGNAAFVQYDEKWGLLSQSGRIVFPLTFNKINELSDKMVAVKNDTAWALFDREEMALKTEYIFQEFVFLNAEQIVSKQIKKDFYGIINSNGEIICPPIYESIFSLSNKGGFAKCNHQWALIDARGKQLSNFMYTSVKEIPSNTNNCFVFDGLKWFLINIITKREIIRREKGFDEVENFSEGKAIVRNQNAATYIDTGGRFVTLRKKYLNLGPTVANMCWVYVSKKKGWILYNLKTNQEMENKFVIEDGTTFTDNIAWAKESDKWAMINKSGVLKTPFIFQRMQASGITNTVWVDASGSGWVLLNDEGVYAVKEPKMYKDVRTFNNGMAEVSDNFGWGLINQQGKSYIPCWYENITNFNNGKGFVKLFDKWALATKSGKILKVQLKRKKKIREPQAQEVQDIKPESGE